MTGEDPVVRSEVGWEESPRGYGGLVLAVKTVQTQLKCYSFLELFPDAPV